MARLEEYRRKRRFDRTPEPGEPDVGGAEVSKAEGREISRPAKSAGTQKPRPARNDGRGENKVFWNQEREQTRGKK
jgi:hypothetical protein